MKPHPYFTDTDTRHRHTRRSQCQDHTHLWSPVVRGHERHVGDNARATTNSTWLTTPDLAFPVSAHGASTPPHAFTARVQLQGERSPGRPPARAADIIPAPLFDTLDGSATTASSSPRGTAASSRMHSGTGAADESHVRHVYGCTYRGLPPEPPVPCAPAAPPLNCGIPPGTLRAPHAVASAACGAHTECVAARGGLRVRSRPSL